MLKTAFQLGVDAALAKYAGWTPARGFVPSRKLYQRMIDAIRSEAPTLSAQYHPGTEGKRLRSYLNEQMARTSLTSNRTPLQNVGHLVSPPSIPIQGALGSRMGRQGELLEDLQKLKRFDAEALAGGQAAYKSNRYPGTWLGNARVKAEDALERARNNPLPLP